MRIVNRIKGRLRRNNMVRRVLSRRLISRFEAVKAPKRLIFEPISACNYRCPKCVYPEMKRERKQADLAKFREFLTAWKAVYGSFESVEFTGAGEVLLSPGFPNLVKSMSEIMPSTRMVTTSNISLFNPEVARDLVQSGLRYWQISLDSIDPEEYARMMGVKSLDVNKILDNIRGLWKILCEDPSPRNGLAILAHRPYNSQYDEKCDEIERAVTGICSEFSRAPYQSLNGRKTGADFVLAEQLLYRSDVFPLPCGYLWNDLVVVNDGTVRICCSDMFDSPVNFGNIFEDSPEEIVNNPTRIQYQNGHRQSDIGALHLCNQCHAPKA